MLKGDHQHFNPTMLLWMRDSPNRNPHGLNVDSMSEQCCYLLQSCGEVHHELSPSGLACFYAKVRGRDVGSLFRIKWQGNILIHANSVLTTL